MRQLLLHPARGAVAGPFRGPALAREEARGLEGRGELAGIRRAEEKRRPGKTTLRDLFPQTLQELRMADDILEHYASLSAMSRAMVTARPTRPEPARLPAHLLQARRFVEERVHGRHENVRVCVPFREHHGRAARTEHLRVAKLVAAAARRGERYQERRLSQRGKLGKRVCPCPADDEVRRCHHIGQLRLEEGRRAVSLAIGGRVFRCPHLVDHEEARKKPVARLRNQAVDERRAQAAADHEEERRGVIAAEETPSAQGIGGIEAGTNGISRHHRLGAKGGRQVVHGLGEGNKDLFAETEIDARGQSRVEIRFVRPGGDAAEPGGHDGRHAHESALGEEQRRPYAPEGNERGGDAGHGRKDVEEVAQGEITAQLPRGNSPKLDARLLDKAFLDAARGAQPDDAPVQLRGDGETGKHVPRRSPTGKCNRRGRRNAVRR